MSTIRPATATPGRVRLLVSVPLLLITLGGGLAGYRLLERWPWLDCLYMTVVTVSTVGFAEVHPLSPAGRLFTMGLILGGVTAAAFALSGLLELVLQRQVRALLGRRSMEKTIDKLQGHLIVCGYGRTGALVAHDLRAAGRAFVVVENDPARAAEITQAGMLVLQGDATDEGVLRQAGIDRADALVAALPTDADNLMLTLTARGLHRALRIVVRAENQGVARKLTWAGASQVVSPHVTGARASCKSCFARRWWTSWNCSRKAGDSPWKCARSRSRGTAPSRERPWPRDTCARPRAA